MTKLISMIAVTMAVALTASTAAAGDYALTLTPNHINGRYELNQVVGFTFGGTIKEQPIPDGQKFRVTWYAGSEKREEKIYTYDSTDPKIRYRVTETGLYRLKAMPLTEDGSNAVADWQAACCGVLCDFDNITKPMTGDFFPSDFDSWWDGEVAAQKEKTFKDGKLDMTKVVMTPYNFQGCSAEQKAVYQGREWYMDALAKTDNYDVRIPALGTNWVAGGLSMPKDRTKKYPAVIYFYGVGWDGVCAVDPMGARDNSAIYFNVNAHGLPEGANWDEDYQNMRAWIENYAAQRDDWGKEYQQIGKGEGRDNFYYRHVFLRAAQAVEFIKALPEWDGTTLIVSGRSQGSAQSVAAAALAEGVTHLYLGISAMCDFTGPANTPKRVYSWPFNNRYPVHPESDYFDCVNFAHRITGKKIGMVFGCSDDPCPATGPASLYNTFPDSNTKDFKTVGAMVHDGARAYEELQPRIAATLKGQADPGFTEEPNPSDVEETLDDDDPEGEETELLFKDGDTIAFLGDSITQAGAYETGFITLFEKVITNLGIEHYTMFKKGIGGDTSKQLLERVDNDIIANHPTWTTFSCGVNDICYAARRQTLDQFKENVTAIFNKFDEAGIKVVVLTTSLLYEKDSAELDSYADWLREEAKRRNYLIAEVNGAMKTELVALGATGGDPWKLTTDGIHMNDAGNRLMAWELLKAFGIAENRKDEIFDIFATGVLIPSTPKAVWNEGTKTLTFYYDTSSHENDDGATKIYPIAADSNKTWGEVLPTVEHVVFDLSFVYFQPTHCSAWFWKAENLKDIDRLDYLNTVNCQSTGQMFGDCGSLTNLNLSFFNTAKVVTMYQMFRNMSSITELDLSSFDTSNVQSFWQMFLGDSSLKRIIVSDKFVTTKVTDGTEMFTGCTSLAGENGTTFDSAKVSAEMAHIDTAGNPGYFSLKGAAPEETPAEPEEPPAEQEEPENPVVSTQLDHWELGSSTMTDGEWTFNVNRRDNDGVLPGSDDLYGLQVLECQQSPDHLTTLDFSKPVVYTEGERKYVITQIKPYGNCLSADGKAVVEHLRLPNHGLGLRINDTFNSCANLVSVEPFLPSDLVTARGMFQGCVKLASPLVYSGSSEFNPWELFEGTAIPSADLSGSTITMLERACFNKCTALKTVKLPPTLTMLTGGVAPFSDCAALELVEFNSVPNTLSAFSGCGALKEVRFYHTAPTATIPAGIYNQLNQDITTYLILDDAETDAIAAWATLTAGGELTDTSTWAQNYAGSAALMAKRPLLRYSVKHVSLAAGQDGAVIAGRPGTFIVSRADDDPLGGSVMVKYTILGGTAEEGVHFEPLSGIVAIPSGEKSGTIEVSPKYFSYIGTETLTLKLAEGDYEIVEGEDEATISLSTEALRSVSIAKGEDADEGTGKVGSFILSRGEGDSVEGPVDVSLSIGGTAIAGQTYRPIKSVVTIPASEKTLKVKVVPYDDPSVTEDTTVEATILPGGYGIGTASATANIKNGATYGGWKFIDGSHISDGTWTFTVARRYYEVFADGVHELWVQGCTGYPTEPTELDFGKAFHNFYDNTYYMIRQLEMNFGGNSAAAAGVGSVVLPDDPGYKYSILGSCFKGCPNLTSVTPFLPKTCDSLGQFAFSSLPNLVQKDLYFYGSDFGAAEGCWGIIDGSTGITNVDLSASTVTVLRRDCFKNCTGLKVVKLPPTIQVFGAPDSSDTGLNNRTPFNGAAGVKLVFTGGALPVMTCNDGNVSAIEFTTPVAELPDNAFYSYYNPYGTTLLNSITFVGEPPAKIGENVFSGSIVGFKKESVTVFVPNYYRAAWREIADEKKLSKMDGGKWTSGTTQLLATYGPSRSGLVFIFK